MNINPPAQILRVALIILLFTVSIIAAQQFRHVNLSTPVGNLSSPRFGESLGLGGAFGGFGGGGGSTGAGNRRIYAQVRLNF